MTLLDIKRDLRDGAFAWPGGYPKFYITADGGTLLPVTVRAQWREIVSSHLNNRRDSGWHVVAVEINWEDGDLTDDHTNERIPSAYGDDETEQEES
jgi:hypothetical protein